MADQISSGQTLATARELFHQRAWNQAYHALQVAGRDTPLPAADLERLANAAHLIGRDGEQFDLLARAHLTYLDQGELRPAARTAIWLSFLLEFRGQQAQGNGWLARAGRLLEQYGADCVELGYFVLPTAVRAFLSGDAALARTGFAEAAAIAARFGDADLAGIARQGEGRALLRLGRVKEGVALLDEVMVSVTTGEVSPTITGELYCSVLEGCHEIYDLRRAQEWTGTLARWCESQPELVVFRGPCQARRSEILLLQGEWAEAESAAHEARERLPDRGSAVAWYQLGELYRRQGDFDQAAEAFREAGVRGLQPEPGLALLRLAQGQLAQAGRSVRRALVEVSATRGRSALLAAAVEIGLAEDDLEAAGGWADELDDIAQQVGTPYLEALAAQTRGLVAGARGDCRSALVNLRRAGELWSDLGLPYDAARVAVLLARACRKEGDIDAATMELEAARQGFERLGARYDLSRLADTDRGPRPEAGLTSRELEVLAMVAAGHTNRAISTRLGISEKTVARHISNIFTKLNLSSRSAATAYAYQHGLISTPT